MTTSTIQALMAQMGGGAAAATIPCGGGSARGDKITILGSGSLATACLFALIAQRVSKDIVLLDTDLSGIQKELMDIEDAALYMGQPNLTFTVDHEKCRDSRVIIIAVGDEILTKDLNDVTLKLSKMREIIPIIASVCPSTVLLVATSPSDVLAWATWRISGLAASRVLGVGCTLATARLKRAVAKRLRVAPTAVHATVIGRGVPAWTALAACGVRLRDVNNRLGTNDDPEDWLSIATDFSTNFNHQGVRATAAAAAHISDAIIRDSRDCLPVATHVSGCRHTPDPNKDVFMSLPCVLGYNGVSYIVRQALSQEEKEQLQHHADDLSEIQAKLKIIESQK